MPGNLRVNLKLEVLFVLTRQITRRFDQNLHFVLPIILIWIVYP